jgi:predicted nucleotide-binding protein (sugar kinase/HSP70/actin superfamily)
MLIGMPQMGNITIPFRAAFDKLGVPYVRQTGNSQRSLSLGVKYAPEGLCIPYKLVLGNLIEAAELGADTLLMPSGYGLCRLGYYARSQEQVLHDLGYRVEIVTIGFSEKKLAGLAATIKRLSNNASWFKLLSAIRFGISIINTLDRLERLTQKIRALEKDKGAASALYSQAVSQIDQARDGHTLNRIETEFRRRLQKVPVDAAVKPLVVGIIGEFFVQLEPFANLDVEKELGKRGVWVKRSIYTSNWTKFTLFLNPLGFDEKRKIHQAARPYLSRDVGGDGWESVGEKVLHAGHYDGLVHVTPFTCMPEVMAQNIMSKTREVIPVLTIVCDEQMGKAGMITRVEAFVDLLERHRRQPKQ